MSDPRINTSPSRSHTTAPPRPDKAKRRRLDEDIKEPLPPRPIPPFISHRSPSTSSIPQLLSSSPETSEQRIAALEAQHDTQNRMIAFLHTEIDRLREEGEYYAEQLERMLEVWDEAKEVLNASWREQVRLLSALETLEARGARVARTRGRTGGTRGGGWWGWSRGRGRGDARVGDGDGGGLVLGRGERVVAEGALDRVVQMAERNVRMFMEGAERLKGVLGRRKWPALDRGEFE